MKIALLTFFGSDNYGAILQSYATIKAFETYGHEVELVNYIIPEPPRSWIKKLMLYPKHLKFEGFRRKYFHNITRKYNSLSDLQCDPPKADCYLVGSDQTWNPYLSRDKARGFFLDFGGDSVIRAAYAASFGVAEWKDSKWICRDDAECLLKKFHLISVRERSGVEIVNNTFGISKVSQVVDPVLLFDKYFELTGEIVPCEEIVLYKFVNSDVFYQKCKEIGVSLNMPVRSLGSIRRIRGVKCSYPDNLEGWIKRIAEARFVITDSFHGTVISLLYQKQFVVWPGERVTRLQSLLEALELTDRFISSMDSVDNIIERLLSPIDYSRVNVELGVMRQKSINVIEQISNLFPIDSPN